MKRVRERVLQLKREYQEEHGTVPTKVLLTRADEAALEAVSAKEIDGERMRTLMVKGVRAAFPEFQDMEVVWDAEETAVE
jgi:hypothetical protein